MPPPPLNVVLLVVDSLRASSLRTPDGPATPFLDSLANDALEYRQAQATECWTLPTHASMFTGLLPSEHQAHFQTMGYQGAAPTVAEMLAAAGFETEVATRNSIFDGSLPGITRGFRTNTLVLSRRGRGLNPAALVLALSKPRFRRQIASTGFFHPSQRNAQTFLTTFARALLPADRELLEHVLARMRQHRAARRPYFLFANLYDVHAPYPPVPASVLRRWDSLDGVLENLSLPLVLSSLGGHRYLREGFRLSATSRRRLLRRYHDAIALMDAKLAAFYAAARDESLLDDTLLIVTSDHGEAFGEHALYLHDASAYQTHLHVPLWIRHPTVGTGTVDDVVSTRSLFDVIAAARHGRFHDTILDADHRGSNPVALAEHFFYPHARDSAPRYRQNLAAARYGPYTATARRDGIVMHDLSQDPEEQRPEPIDVGDFAALCRRRGAGVETVAAAARHLARVRA